MNLDIKITVNPTNNPYVQRHLPEVGFLPDFITSGDGDIEENIVNNYGFFCGWTSQDSWVIENDVFKYPDDPDMPALMKFEQDGKTLLIFQYGLVGIIDKQGIQKYSRFD